MPPLSSLSSRTLGELSISRTKAFLPQLNPFWDWQRSDAIMAGQKDIRAQRADYIAPRRAGTVLGRPGMDVDVKRLHRL